MPAGPAAAAPSTTSSVRRVGGPVVGRGGHPLGGRHRRAGRRVDLGVVVQLDDLGGLEVRRRDLGEAHHQHRADGEVGGDDAVRPPSNRRRTRASSSVENPVVPTTAWMPCIASQRRFSRAASATVKSTTTSAPASAVAAVAGDGRRRAGWRSSRVVRIDGGDQLESGSSATAAHTVAPIRPPAPTDANPNRHPSSSAGGERSTERPQVASRRDRATDDGHVRPRLARTRSITRRRRRGHGLPAGELLVDGAAPRRASASIPPRRDIRLAGVLEPISRRPVR